MFFMYFLKLPHFAIIKCQFVYRVFFSMASYHISALHFIDLNLFSIICYSAIFVIFAYVFLIKIINCFSTHVQTYNRS